MISNTMNFFRSLPYWGLWYPLVPIAIIGTLLSWMFGGGVVHNILWFGLFWLYLNGLSLLSDISDWYLENHLTLITLDKIPLMTRIWTTFLVYLLALLAAVMIAVVPWSLGWISSFWEAVGSAFFYPFLLIGVVRHIREFRKESGYVG